VVRLSWPGDSREWAEVDQLVGGSLTTCALPLRHWNFAQKLHGLTTLPSIRFRSKQQLSVQPSLSFSVSCHGLHGVLRPVARLRQDSCTAHDLGIAHQALLELIIH